MRGLVTTGWMYKLCTNTRDVVSRCDTHDGSFGVIYKVWEITPAQHSTGPRQASSYS